MPLRTGGQEAVSANVRELYHANAHKPKGKKRSRKEILAAAYHAAHRKKAERSGTPVRNTRDDIPGLLDSIADNPHDSARWHLFADAVDEVGKPAFAEVLRMIGNGKPLPPGQYSNARIVGYEGMRASPDFRATSDRSLFNVLGTHVRIDAHKAPGERFVAIGGKPLYEHGAHWRVPEELANRLVAEADPPVDRMQQTGQPVRNTRDDIPGLYEAVKQDPHDLARWHLLADALDEVGKVATAEAIRTLVTRGKPQGEGRRKEIELWENRPSRRDHGENVKGFVAGVPIDANRRWLSFTHSHESMPGTYFWGPNELTDRVISEFDPPADQPTGMRRTGVPVRCTRDDIAGLLEAVKQQPFDTGRWHLLADALDEIGKPATAEAMRMIATEGERVETNDCLVAGYENNYRGFPGQREGERYIKIAGVPADLEADQSGRQYLVRIGSTGPTDWEGVRGVHWGIPKEHGERILAEADPPADRMQRTGQPVRLGTRLDPHVVAAMAHAHPDDSTPRLLFADHADEQGYPMIARVAREGDPDAGLYGYGAGTSVNLHNIQHPSYSSKSLMHIYAWPYRDGGGLAAINLSEPYRFHFLPIEKTEDLHRLLHEMHEYHTLHPEYHWGPDDEGVEWHRFGLQPPPERMSARGKLVTAIRLARGIFSESRNSAVRLTRDDVPGLLQAVKENPHDPARWHLLADAVDEIGKPGLADAMRLMAERPALFRHADSPEVKIIDLGNRSSAGWGSTSSADREKPIEATAAGVPLSLLRHPLKSAMRNHFVAMINFPQKGYNHLGIIWGLPLEHAARIIHEADEFHGQVPFYQDVEDLRPGQTRMQRPVRCTRDDIAGLFEAVRQDPHDDARWHLLADALDEIGKPHTAGLMREIGSKGEKLFGSTYASYLPNHREYRDSGKTYWADRVFGHAGTIAGVPVNIHTYPANKTATISLHEHRDKSPVWAGVHEDIAHRILSEFDERPHRAQRTGQPVRCKLDAAGGVIPQDEKVAKRFDLVTLPPEVKGGAHCMNCMYAPDEEPGRCKKKEIAQIVNSRQCCSAWNRPDIHRSWGEQVHMTRMRVTNAIRAARGLPVRMGDRDNPDLDAAWNDPLFAAPKQPAGHPLAGLHQAIRSAEGTRSDSTAWMNVASHFTNLGLHGLAKDATNFATTGGHPMAYGGSHNLKSVAQASLNGPEGLEGELARNHGYRPQQPPGRPNPLLDDFMSTPGWNQPQKPPPTEHTYAPGMDPTGRGGVRVIPHPPPLAGYHERIKRNPANIKLTPRPLAIGWTPPRRQLPTALPIGMPIAKEYAPPPVYDVAKHGDMYLPVAHPAPMETARHIPVGKLVDTHPLDAPLAGRPVRRSAPPVYDVAPHGDMWLPVAHHAPPTRRLSKRDQLVGAIRLAKGIFSIPRNSPVRLTRDDIPALWANVERQPEDDAHWHLLADALDEIGKPHTAGLMRRIGGIGWRHFDDVPGLQATGPLRNIVGHIGGVPIKVEHLGNWVHFRGHNSGMMPFSAYMKPEDAQPIIDEFDHPEHMARTGQPVRCTRDDIPGLLRAVAENPEDMARHHLLADALDETGSPLAGIIRDYASGDRQSGYWIWNDPRFIHSQGYYEHAPLEPESDPNGANLFVIGNHLGMRLTAVPSALNRPPGEMPLALFAKIGHEWPRFNYGPNKFEYALELEPHDVKHVAEGLGGMMADNLEHAARVQWAGGNSYEPAPTYDEAVGQPKMETPFQLMVQMGRRSPELNELHLDHMTGAPRYLPTGSSISNLSLRLYMTPKFDQSKLDPLLGHALWHITAMARDKRLPIRFDFEPAPRRKAQLDHILRSYGFRPNRGNRMDYSLSSPSTPTYVWHPPARQEFAKCEQPVRMADRIKEAIRMAKISEFRDAIDSLSEAVRRYGTADEAEKGRLVPYIHQLADELSAMKVARAPQSDLDKANRAIEGAKSTGWQGGAFGAAAKQPWEMTSTEFMAARHPEIEKMRQSEGMGAAKLPQAVGKALFEHKGYVQKALERGENVPEHILAEHGIEKERQAFVSDPTARYDDPMSMHLATNLFMILHEGVPVQYGSNARMSDPKFVSEVLRDHGPDMVHVHFTDHGDSKLLKGYVGRIKRMADMAGYDIGEPVRWNNQGMIHNDKGIVTLKRRPAAPQLSRRQHPVRLSTEAPFTGWLSPGGSRFRLEGEEHHGDWAARRLGMPADPTSKGKAFDQLHRTGWVRVSAPGRLGTSNAYQITTASLRHPKARERISDFLLDLHPQDQVHLSDDAWVQIRGTAQEALHKMFSEDNTHLARCKPVRMTRDDIPGLYAAVKEDPHDDARWHLLADALDEVGKPHTAGAIRYMLEGGRKERTSFQRDGRPFMTKHIGESHRHHGQRASGTVASLPISMDSSWIAFNNQPIVTPGCLYTGDRELAKNVVSEFDPPPEKLARSQPVRAMAREAILMSRTPVVDLRCQAC